MSSWCVSGLALRQHVDVQGAHQSQQLYLLSKSTNRKAKVRRIGRELPERGVNRNPSLQPDLGPRVVVELSVQERESCCNACRYAIGPCQCDEQLRVFVAVALPRTQRCQRARHANGDALLERIVQPRVDALRYDTRVRLRTA